MRRQLRGAPVTAARGSVLVVSPHPDHGAAAGLVSGASTGLDIEKGFLEVWTPLDRMDVIVDITATIETKAAAIRAYESQCRVVGFEEAFVGLARYRGEMFSWPDGHYAEIFVHAP